MASIESMVRHATIDRVLLAVCGGCDTVESVRDRCDIGKNVALRSLSILVDDKLLRRKGNGLSTIFKPTKRGVKSSKWLKTGGSRTGPRVDDDEGEL